MDADSVMHPEKLLVHMLPTEAEDWRFRLRKMDQRIRLADRDALLDEAASGIGYWNILAA